MKHNQSSVQGSGCAGCVTTVALALLTLFILAVVVGKGLSVGMGV